MGACKKLPFRPLDCALHTLTQTPSGLRRSSLTPRPMAYATGRFSIFLVRCTRKVVASGVQRAGIAVGTAWRCQALLVARDEAA